MVYGGVILPWEWDDHYRLRNTFYPYYLAAPLWTLKTLGLDYGPVVKACPYLAQSLLVIISDSYLWDLGKRLVGKPATSIAFLLYLTNRTQNELIVRCYTNSLEEIFNIIAFYYYLDVKDKFNKNTIIMTALISISFMMRNTSPVGWIPLLLIKIFYHRSLVPFILSGIFVALPIMAFCVLLDTLYFGGGSIVLTSVNFMNVNLMEGLSNYFGTDPFYFYLIVGFPGTFTVLVPFVFIALYTYYSDMKAKKDSPLMIYMVVFYVFVFSVISHKELRFMLPIFPFVFLCLGYLFFKYIKTYPKQIRFLCYFSIIIETAIIVVLTLFHERAWTVLQDIKNRPEPLHSFYSMARFNAPYYTLLHNPENRTKIYLPAIDPTFSRLKDGHPIPILHDFQFNIVQEMLNDIESGKIRPQYLLLVDFECAFQQYCYETFMEVFKELDMYEHDKSYPLNIGADLKLKTLFLRQGHLYKLKKQYTPI